MTTMSGYWLYRQLQSVDLLASVASSDAAAAHQLVNRQQMVIRDLSVTVAVLSKMLVDAGLIDEQVMRARVGAEIEELIEEAKLVECTECHKSVPSVRTQIRLDGVVCDDCIAKGR